MDKSAIVIIFQEPHSVPSILLAIQELYNDIPNIKAYAVYDKSAEAISDVVNHNIKDS